MQEGWRKYKLEDISSIKSGKRLPKGHSLISDKTEYPYIRLVNIKNNKIQKDEMLFLKQETQRVIAKYIVNEKDVCFAIVGDTIGLVFYIDKNFNGANLTENAARLTDFSVFVNSKYVYYYLLSPIGYREIMSRKVGSAQGKLPLYNIKSLEISIPPFQEQKAIASILSALDDKIELNLQMNKTLEEMSIALYKHWFVDFGPFQNGKFVETDIFGNNSLIRIPAEFEVVSVKNSISRLKAINKYDQKNVLIQGDIRVFDQSSSRILGFHNNEPDFKSDFKNPTLIFGDHTCRMEIICENFSVGPNLIPFRSKELANTYLLYLGLKEKVNTNDYKRHWSELMLQQIILPKDKSLILEFNSLIKGNFNMISKNELENQTLTTLRDTLLPKLISGEVRVKDIEHLVAASL